MFYVGWFYNEKPLVQVEIVLYLGMADQTLDTLTAKQQQAGNILLLFLVVTTVFLIVFFVSPSWTGGFFLVCGMLGCLMGTLNLLVKANHVVRYKELNSIPPVALMPVPSNIQPFVQTNWGFPPSGRN